MRSLSAAALVASNTGPCPGTLRIPSTRSRSRCGDLSFLAELNLHLFRIAGVFFFQDPNGVHDVGLLGLTDLPAHKRLSFELHEFRPCVRIELQYRQTDRLMIVIQGNRGGQTKGM